MKRAADFIHRSLFRIVRVLLTVWLSGCGLSQLLPATNVRPTATLLRTATTPAQATAPHKPTSPPTPTPQAGTFIKSPEPAGPMNLVAAANGGRIVSATDERAEYPASNLIDGYKYDFGEWFTNEPGKLPQTVVFALGHGEVKTINRVVLNSWTSEWRTAWVKDFEIYVSDTSPWVADMKMVGEFALDYVGIDQTFTFDPTPAKYVALIVTSNNGADYGTLLNEFEVYEAPAEARHVKPGNLAAEVNGGHIVAFSSQDPNGEWPPRHLIDSASDTSEGWSSDENLQEPQYVVFAFKDDTPRQIDRVVLNPYSDKYHEDWIKEFELRASDSRPDLDLMKSLGRFTLQQVGQDQQFTFAPVKARYLALIPLTNYGGTAFALNEFEAYAAPAAVENLEQSKPAAPAGDESSVNVPQHPAETQGTRADVSSQKTGSTVDNVEVELSTTDILPSAYHLYGSYFESLAKSTLTNHNSFPVTVRVQADVLNYTEAAIETLTLGPGEAVTVEQNPPLLPGVFEQLNETKKASLHLQVDYLKEGERRLVYEGTLPLKIWAHGDVTLAMPGYHNPFLFEATLATPNDPALADVLRAAADYVPGGIITWGYGDEKDSDGKVFNNMKAVYKAVADRGVIYVATGIPFVPQTEKAQGFYLQRIKLPYEVLQTRSGMCIETSLLFASLYEKILLDPVFIRIPGHVFLAIPISEGSSTYYVLETTMVGRASFESALAVGAREFEEVLPNLGQDQQDNYYWLNLSRVREEGILPIPWR